MAKTGGNIPREGRKALPLTLQSDRAETVRLSDLKGSIVVLYFYPKDNTPGCTVEAQQFRDLQKHFQQSGARILGVSPDTVAAHGRFVEKQGLNFTLLADVDHKVAERYGVWVEKNMYGRKFWGVQRSTFLIDREGAIARIWPKVKPKGHGEEVLDAVRSL